MQNIGVVVVSYHNEAMTKKYITEELPKLASTYTVVVVNNASTREESKKMARECGLTFVNDYSGGASFSWQMLSALDFRKLRLCKRQQLGSSLFESNR